MSQFEQGRTRVQQTEDTTTANTKSEEEREKALGTLLKSRYI